jgi:hypothetical protein
MEISMSPAPIHFRLDSVLCGPSNPYKVEVQAIVNDKPIDLYSEALTWTSLNPVVATVNEVGEITGHASGTTQVIGQIDDFLDTISVRVEMPADSIIVWDDFRNVASWELKGSPTSFNPSLTIPEDASASVVLNFTYGSGRNPFIQLSKDSLLFSKPEKILFPITSNAVFEKVIVMIRANNSTTTEQITFLNPTPGQENILEIDVDERFGTDVAIFPLHFLSVKFVPNSETAKGECYITLPGIIEVFSEETSDLESINSSSSNSSLKYIKNGTLYIQSNGEIYDAIGVKVMK